VGDERQHAARLERRYSLLGAVPSDIEVDLQRGGLGATSTTERSTLWHDVLAGGDTGEKLAWGRTGDKTADSIFFPKARITRSGSLHT
jgi:hypothetical protein